MLASRRPSRAGSQWRKTAGAALASLLLALGASSAGAQPVEWTRLARAADVVVLGECVAETAAWDDGIIATTVQFRPHRFYKGNLAPILTVKTLGGRVGDDAMAASHGAALAAGEQVLLFLQRSEFGPYYVVLGGDAGKLTVKGLPGEAGRAPTMGTRAELIRLLNRSAGVR